MLTWLLVKLAAIEAYVADHWRLGAALFRRTKR